MNDVRTQAARGLLASLRTRLLDLTATNPLISFNHTRNTGSRTHLRAVDIDINALVQAVMEGQDVTLYALPPLDDIQADAFEDLDDTFLAIEGATQEETGGDGATDDAAGKVATGGRQSPAQNKKRKPAITRAAIEAHAIRSGINVSYEMCRGPNTDASGVSFQTLLWPESFQKTASKIYDTVRGHQEETGINTLHLALGSLNGTKPNTRTRHSQLHLWSFKLSSSARLFMEFTNTAYHPPMYLRRSTGLYPRNYTTSSGSDCRT